MMGLNRFAEEKSSGVWSIGGPTHRRRSNYRQNTNQPTLHGEGFAGGHPRPTSVNLSAERVNDFETPGVMRLASKQV